MSISSIRASRKPVLATGVLGLLAGLFAIMITGLVSLSGWAERDMDAHPFKDEDWLRYLLDPRLESDGRPRLFLAGPSTVRENIRFEMVEAAFPGFAVYQGGLSGGTLEDTLAALEYLRLIHGDAVLPREMVLGISLRTIANISDGRPFQGNVSVYSPWYRIGYDGNGVHFERKSWLEGLRAAALFLGRKEPDRFRVAVEAAALDLVEASPGLRDGIDRLLHGAPGPIDRHRDRLPPGGDSITDVLRARISPYKYERLPRRSDRQVNFWLTLPESIWAQILRWDATQHPEAERGLRSFVAYAKAHGIRLLVVNMPERSIVRASYLGDYNAYLDLVRRAIGDTPFLDLREFLSDDELYDAYHATRAGAARLTREVIAHLGG
jgi:hypothetical protein